MTSPVPWGLVGSIACPLTLGPPRPAVARLETFGAVAPSSTGAAALAALAAAGAVLSPWRAATICARRLAAWAFVIFGAGA